MSHEWIYKLFRHDLEAYGKEFNINWMDTNLPELRRRFYTFACNPKLSAAIKRRLFELKQKHNNASPLPGSSAGPAQSGSVAAVKVVNTASPAAKTVNPTLKGAPTPAVKVVTPATKVGPVAGGKAVNPVSKGGQTPAKVVTPASKGGPTAAAKVVTPASKAAPTAAAKVVTPASKAAPTSAAKVVTPASKAAAKVVTPASKAAPTAAAKVVTPASKAAPTAAVKVVNPDSKGATTPASKVVNPAAKVGSTAAPKAGMPVSKVGTTPAPKVVNPASKGAPVPAGKVVNPAAKRGPPAKVPNPASGGPTPAKVLKPAASGEVPSSTDKPSLRVLNPATINKSLASKVAAIVKIEPVDDPDFDIQVTESTNIATPAVTKPNVIADTSNGDSATEVVPSPGVAKETTDEVTTASENYAPPGCVDWDAALAKHVCDWRVEFDGDGDAEAFLKIIKELAATDDISKEDLLKVMRALLKGEAYNWFDCISGAWESWEKFEQKFLKYFCELKTACKRCAQQGHSSRECGNKRVLLCWFCGRRDTRTLDCCSGHRQAPSTPNPWPIRIMSGFLTASVRIGTETHMAMINTGAVRSYISDYLVNEVGGQEDIQATDVNLKLMNGTTLRITEELSTSIYLGTRKCEKQLLVVPEVMGDLVLGMDCLQKLGVKFQLAAFWITPGPYATSMTYTPAVLQNAPNGPKPKLFYCEMCGKRSLKSEKCCESDPKEDQVEYPITPLQMKAGFLYVTVVIGGKAYTAMLNTGSVNNYISEALASKLLTPEQISTFDNSVKLINGSIQQTQRLAKLPLCLGEKSVELPVVVLPQLASDLMFGMDALRKFESSFVCGKRSIRLVELDVTDSIDFVPPALLEEVENFALLYAKMKVKKPMAVRRFVEGNWHRLRCTKQGKIRFNQCNF